MTSSARPTTIRGLVHGADARLLAGLPDPARIPTAPYFGRGPLPPRGARAAGAGEFTNREHPLLGKQLLALGIALLGDNPWGWRLVPTLFGALALYAAMRALWHATLSRFATLAYGVLLGPASCSMSMPGSRCSTCFTSPSLRLHSGNARGAMREPETGRWRLALAGVALGLAMAAKWNALVQAPVPGLVFLVMRARAGRRRLLLSRRGAPVPGITLLEAALVGLVPLLVYRATYLPAFWFERGAIGSPDGPADLIAHHIAMLGMQSGVTQPPSLFDQWLQWLLNARGSGYSTRWRTGRSAVSC
jgi:dolichyl-phosphate-mannose-protein mannosyltransferase